MVANLERLDVRLILLGAVIVSHLWGGQVCGVDAANGRYVSVYSMSWRTFVCVNSVYASFRKLEPVQIDLVNVTRWCDAVQRLCCG